LPYFSNDARYLLNRESEREKERDRERKTLFVSVKIEIDVVASIAFDLSQLMLNGQPPFFSSLRPLSRVVYLRTLTK